MSCFFAPRDRSAWNSLPRCCNDCAIRDPLSPPPPASCSGVYWQGSQYGRAKKEMNDLIAKLKALV